MIGAAEMRQSDLIRFTGKAMSVEAPCEGCRRAVPDGCNSHTTPRETGPLRAPARSAHWHGCNVGQQEAPAWRTRQPHRAPAPSCGGDPGVAQIDREQLHTGVGPCSEKRVAEIIGEGTPGLVPIKPPALLHRRCQQLPARSLCSKDTPSGVLGCHSSLAGLIENGQGIQVRFDDPCRSEVRGTQRSQGLPQPQGVPLLRAGQGVSELAGEPKQCRNVPAAVPGRLMELMQKRRSDWACCGARVAKTNAKGRRGHGVITCSRRVMKR